MWKVQLFELDFDHLEVDAVAEVVANGWLTMGEKTSLFEEEFNEFLGGTVQCCAVANGTAALHMALLAVGVSSGDEVIIPALTFIADLNVVKAVSGKPILADCSSLTDWNVSAESIERCITARTKAVIVVHYAGFPCKDIVEISQLCRDRGIKLIEDVAHAPGSSVGGVACGTFGDIGCFSFFSNKNLSVGEGGMVCASEADLLQQLRYFRSHGMTTLTMDRHEGRAITYDVVQTGLNYRLDEIRAAIGLVQLKKLPSGNMRRGLLTNSYRSDLAESGILIPFEKHPSNTISAYHILPILLPVGANRSAIMQALKKEGIQSSIHYPSFWDFTAYKGDFSPEDSPFAAEISLRELTLPLFPTMTNEEVNLVTKSLIGAL